jgi:CheY-like chemotaxis protein
MANEVAAPRQRRILVVDDNQEAANALALLLKQFDQVVQQAYDGLAAVQAALDFRPEIVLLDLVMPGMDGFAVAQRLRELEPMHTSRMVIVALTGRDEEAFREATAEAGFDAHLTKPAKIDELLKILA